MIQLSNAFLLSGAVKDLTRPFELADIFGALIALKPPAGRGRVDFDVSVVLALFGGKKDEPFTLSVAVVYPDPRESLPLLNRPLTWPGGFTYTLVVPVLGSVDHVESGCYRLRFLADGRPLGEVLMPIFWTDEVEGEDDSALLSGPTSQ